MSATALSRAEAERGSGARNDAWLGLVLAAPIVLTMIGLVIWPVIATMWQSLHRVDPMQAGTPFVGLSNYTALFTDKNALTAWANTLFYVVLAVTLETVGGVAAAVLLNRLTIGRRWLLAIVILPWALPGVVNAIVWQWIYNPSHGLLNGLLTAIGFDFDRHVWFNDRSSALILVTIVHVWRTMPLTVVIVLAALQSIPKDIYEAARIDGANRFQLFRMMTLPLIRSGLAIALAQSTVTAFNLFDEVWILAGSSLDTRSILVQVYLEAFQNLRFSRGMALSVLVMFISLAVSLVFVSRVYRETRLD
ncbi:carbohydrate ABC transporter permease [Labrys portucalensis]|uniref:Carbohydrate ABC transporter permease n=1 Tax=Labrys neptuniae TaxID=376174 RepID=A0ABV6ZND0_9HYPH